MKEHRDEQQDQYKYLQIIDFNNFRDLTAFGQRLAELLLEQECHSLQAVEERYSLLTGVAVRYCQLLAKAKRLQRVLPQPPRLNRFGYAEMFGSQEDASKEKQFLQRLMVAKRKLAGGQEGILLSTVNYHGREFVIRGIFGGWHGEVFAQNGAVDAQCNCLSGAIHLHVFEQGKVVAKLKLQRWIRHEHGRTDEKLSVGSDLSWLNSGLATQIFDGNDISEYNKSDSLLGHFLHQLMIEIFQLTGLKVLEFRADNECDLITVANGCWPHGKEDAKLTRNLLELLRQGKSLLHDSFDGYNIYELRLNELDHPRVYFNGAVEPVSWLSLIAENPIIIKPEQFAWPQFCGILLADQLQNQRFSYASVDLEARLSCAELIKLGRVGIQDLDRAVDDIQLCQTAVGALSTGSLLDRSMILAQFDVLFAARTKSIPEMMAMAFSYDPDGGICRALMDKVLDTVLMQRLQAIERGLSDNPDSGFDAVMDMLHEFLDFKLQHPDSSAVEICIKQINKRLSKIFPALFKKG